MLKSVHEKMLREAVGDNFSPRALDAIMAANFGVDSLLNILLHGEYHFDNNAFEESRGFIESQHAVIRPALERGDAKTAWEAFGRLTHTAQDFYSHSNYVDLWLATRPHGMVPGPKEIDPLDDSLVDSPSLRSAKIYWPVELLTLVPGIKRLVIPRMPPDSHSHMNLDSEARGPMFEYAFHAAVKRTRVEFDTVMKRLTRDQGRLFADIT
jgi:hypothetical protein